MITTEDLAARIERLEHLFEERAMERPSRADCHAESHAFWARIPFSAWLKISGPTFAVMAAGFAVVWNAQQETTQRILDLQSETTDRILAVQHEIVALEERTTDRILTMQQTTTDRILAVQQQILDLQRERPARK